MEKEQFKRELQLALKDPRAYFGVRKQKDPKTGKTEMVCDEKKLNGFFQDFSTQYLDSDVAQLTDKFPIVKFAKMQEHDKHAVGKYHEQERGIQLNIDMFLKGSMSSTVFTGFLATLCHEHQHFKQHLYIELKKAGKEDQAKQLEPMLGITPEKENGVSVEEIEKSITQPTTGKSLIAHDMFMAHTMPDKYKQMKSGNILVNELGRKVGHRSPIEVAHYFHDPHEVDARERSVEVFDRKLGEISQGDPLIDKYRRRTTKVLTSFNKKVLNIQPKRVFDLFEEERAKIGSEHFLSFAGMIEKSLNKEKMDISQINDQGQFDFDHKPSKTEVARQSFVIVLQDRLSTLPKQEAQKLLEDLQNSGNAYAAQIASQFASKPEITKPTASEIAEEKEALGLTDPEPEFDYIPSNSHEEEQELSPEELRALEQMSKNL